MAAPCFPDLAKTDGPGLAETGSSRPVTLGVAPDAPSESRKSLSAALPAVYTLHQMDHFWLICTICPVRSLLVRIQILRVVDGAPVKALNLPVNAVRPSWSRESNSVRFLNPENGILNLWEQSRAGGEPKQLTHFTSDPIVNYAFSLDGRRLTFIRGYVSSDVVLLGNFRWAQSEISRDQDDLSGS